MVTFPHGETNVTLVCQNRCVSCNHFIPIQKPWYIDPVDLARDLNAAAKVMHFEIYNLVGGEPTLHPQIVELLQIVKASGIADRREITSNGQLCERWPDAFYQNLDDLIVTPYKLTGNQIALITQKCLAFGVRLEWHPVIFTQAIYRDASTERGRALYRDCWYRRNRNVIDGGYFHLCCIGRFIPELFQGKEQSAEAIALDGLTEETLMSFINRAETPAMCNVCASNQGAVIQWRETRRENWLEESLG